MNMKQRVGLFLFIISLYLGSGAAPLLPVEIVVAIVFGVIGMVLFLFGKD